MRSSPSDASPGASVPKPMVGGTVAANGTILAGSGFTVTHSSTGQYTITLASPVNNPLVLVTTLDQSVVIAGVMNSPTSVSVLCSTPAAFTDQRFEFMVFRIS